MESVAAASYLPPLAAPHERDAVGRELANVLHDLIALSLIGKQLHWAVYGPLFHPLHHQLDGLAASWRELADTVAERAMALGVVPDGQAQAVVSGAQVTPVAQGPIEYDAAIRELIRRVADVSERVRARLDQVGGVDLISQDVLIDVVRQLEKQQWMLRVQLDGRS